MNGSELNKLKELVRDLEKVEIPAAEIEDGYFECPMCYGDGRVEGVLRTEQGIGDPDLLETYGMDFWGIGDQHIKLEKALRILWEHRAYVLKALENEKLSSMS
jgi:hypothetical protein